MTASLTTKLSVDVLCLTIDERMQAIHTSIHSWRTTRRTVTNSRASTTLTLITFNTDESFVDTHWVNLQNKSVPHYALFVKSFYVNDNKGLTGTFARLSPFRVYSARL